MLPDPAVGMDAFRTLSSCYHPVPPPPQLKILYETLHIIIAKHTLIIQLGIS